MKPSMGGIQQRDGSLRSWIRARSYELNSFGDDLATADTSCPRGQAEDKQGDLLPGGGRDDLRGYAPSPKRQLACRDYQDSVALGSRKSDASRNDAGCDLRTDRDGNSRMQRHGLSLHHNRNLLIERSYVEGHASRCWQSQDLNASR